jgi:hypothetical protein
MDVSPPRRLGLVIGALILLAGLAAVVLGVSNLDEISPVLLVWGALPVVGTAAAALAGYRLYGLLTARYVLSREGIGIRWGLAVEEIPLPQARLERPPTEVRRDLRPSSRLVWPGCVTGSRQVAGVGVVEFFTTRGPDDSLLVFSPERILAISPPDPEAFVQAFAEAARLGPLDRIEARSVRPDLLPSRLWSDWIARALLLAGVAAPVALLGFLGLRSTSLPDQVPLGYDALGNPGALVAPGRLLLLPLIGGLCWATDLILGSAFYQRPRDRWIAYGLWGTAVVVGGLLWAAALRLTQIA